MTNPVEQKNLTWYRSLPVMHFNSVAEINKLGEYSATNPTGVTIGKTWRRENGSFDEKFIRLGGKPKWVICRYEEAPPQLRRLRLGEKPHDDEAIGVIPYPAPEGKKWQGMCKTVMYRPVIRVKAKAEYV